MFAGGLGASCDFHLRDNQRAFIRQGFGLYVDASVRVLIRCPGGSGYSNVIDIFDVKTAAWTTAALSVARAKFAATSLPNEGIAMFAGGTSALQLLRLIALVVEKACVILTLGLPRFVSHMIRLLTRCTGDICPYNIVDVFLQSDSPAPVPSVTIIVMFMIAVVIIAIIMCCRRRGRRSSTAAYSFSPMTSSHAHYAIPLYPNP
jgi:hypothetical protein